MEMVVASAMYQVAVGLLTHMIVSAVQHSIMDGMNRRS